jgi:tight adherence protein B
MVVVAVRAVVVVSTGLFPVGPLVLLVAAVAVASVAVAIVAVVRVRAGGIAPVRFDPARLMLRRRLQRHIVEPDRPPQPGAGSSVQPAMVDALWTAVAPPARLVEDLAERALRHHGILSGLRVRVDRSGLRITAAEVVGASVVGALATALVTIIVMAPLPAAVAMTLAVGALPAVAVSVAAARRRALFTSGLADLLNLLAGTLRAGLPLSQAVGTVVGDMAGPVAQEFRRLGAEIDLGRPLPAALRAVAHRMANEEVEWVAVAVEIHQQAGGNLAELLDTVAATSAERQRLRREVATLTAEGRISAVVLGILPPALALIIWVVNPGYLGSLAAEPTGTAMVLAAAVAMVIGFVWMHRIVGIDL